MFVNVFAYVSSPPALLDEPIDINFDKRMSLLEYLLWVQKKTPKELVSADRAHKKAEQWWKARENQVWRK